MKEALYVIGSKGELLRKRDLETSGERWIPLTYSGGDDNYESIQELERRLKPKPKYGHPEPHPDQSKFLLSLSLDGVINYNLERKNSSYYHPHSKKPIDTPFKIRAINPNKSAYKYTTTVHFREPATPIIESLDIQNWQAVFSTATPPKK